MPMTAHPAVAYHEEVDKVVLDKSIDDGYLVVTS